VWRTNHQPLGRPTRGKTAPNRLRRLDTFVSAVFPGLLTRSTPGVVLDLGYGRVPRTTLETAARWRRLNPALVVVGVELDRERVAAAAAFNDARTRFVRGGFDADVGPVRIVRAMNVLRQYDEDAVAGAWAELGARLEEGGLMIEGTCDPFGRVIAVNLQRKRAGALIGAGVLFSTNHRGDFEPASLQPVLPKNLIHRVRPGEAVHTFFRDWELAWKAAAPWSGFGPRARFWEAARLLAREQPLAPRPWLARHGYVWWRPSP